MAGRPIQEVITVAQLLAQFGRPYELQWLEQYGSHVWAAQPFPDDGSRLDQGLFTFLDNLSIIQNHVRGTVVVPRDIDEEAVRVVAEVSYLLRHGELHGSWTSIELHLKEGFTRRAMASIIVDEGTFAHETSWALELEDRCYDLGPMHQILASVRLADEQPSDEGLVRLVPGNDKGFVQRPGSLQGMSG